MFFNLYVLPRVKLYLESSGGDPVDLRSIPNLHKVVIRFIQNPEIKLHPPMRSKAEKLKVRITIPLYRKTDCQSIILNSDLSFIEYYADLELKDLMTKYVRACELAGVQIASAIREFQDRYGYNDLVWKFESIRKHYARHPIDCDPFIKNKRVMIASFLKNSVLQGCISQKLVDDMGY